MFIGLCCCFKCILLCLPVSPLKNAYAISLNEKNSGLFLLKSKGGTAGKKNKLKTVTECSFPLCFPCWFLIQCGRENEMTAHMIRTSEFKMFHNEIYWEETILLGGES